MINVSRERDGASGLLLEHDPGEWRVPEPLLMEVSLKRLVPSPSGHDVVAQSRAFYLKSEVSCPVRLRKAVEADVYADQYLIRIRGFLSSMLTRTPITAS